MSYCFYTEFYFLKKDLCSFSSRQADLMILIIPSYCHCYLSINNTASQIPAFLQKYATLEAFCSPACSWFVHVGLIAALWLITPGMDVSPKVTASVVLSFSLWNSIGYNCKCKTSLISPPSQLLSTNPTARGGSPPSLQTLAWMWAFLKLP